MKETNVKKLIDIYTKAYLDETFSSNLYLRLSEMVKGSFSERLRELADMEAVHAGFWKEVLEELGFRTDDLRISKTKLAFFSLAARILGLPLLIKLLEEGEETAISLYTRILNEGWMPEERSRVLKEILEDELLHESFFQKEEERLKDFLNHVRDAVLGMSDGLVEVLSVTTGLAGAYGNPLYIALGGLIVGF